MAVAFSEAVEPEKESPSSGRGTMQKRKSCVYHSVTPANNMVLKRKWDEKLYNVHRSRVENAKPIIDDRPPSIRVHLHLNLGKVQKEQQRQANIERENQLLLERISHIMRTSGNRINKHVTRKSLPKTSNNREILRITLENQAILKRIQDKEAHYNHRKWLNEWRANRKYVANLSRYPNPPWLVNANKKFLSQLEAKNRKSIPEGVKSK